MRIDVRPWLRSRFTTQQQRHIRDVFQPMGLDRDAESLLVGDSFQVTYDLGHLVGWFDNPRDRAEYATPMLERLVELVRSLDLTACSDVERLHFTYQAIMEHAYKQREDSAWLDVTIWAAEQQVAIAPQTAAAMRRTYGSEQLPKHTGFERLAILADKARNDTEVIRISEAAMSEGWNGDWERRIAKARKRSVVT
jgi:hypothetical protein